MVLAVWTSIGEGRADSVKPRVVVMTDIGAAPDGTFVALTGVPVTAGTRQFAGYAYVESPDRSWGIRVNTNEWVDIGDVITVRGEIHTSTAGERYIQAHAVTR